MLIGTSSFNDSMRISLLLLLLLLLLLMIAELEESSVGALIDPINESLTIVHTAPSSSSSVCRCT